MPAFSRIDLPALAAGKTKRKRKSVTLRPIGPTLTLERDLAVAYLRVVRGWREIIAELILPVYAATHERVTMDDVTGGLAAATDRAKGDALRLVAEARQKAQAWAVRVEKWHLGQWAKIVEAGTGVKLAGVLLSEDAATQIGIALERNAALIRGISDDMAKRVEGAVWQGIANQTPRREIAKTLQGALDIGRRRAIGIARDQTGKLSGELDRLRQTQAGISSYVWKSSHVLNYRPEHLARDGREYRWDEPPYDGHPKQAINCSCNALPVLNF